MKPLAHITLNTGHRRAATRQGVLDEVVDQLLPLVDSGGGPLWVPGWHLDIMTADSGALKGPPVPGAAFFQIGPEPMSKTPYVMCMTAWREEVSADAWRQAAELPALMAAALPVGWSMPSRRRDGSEARRTMQDEHASPSALRFDLLDGSEGRHQWRWFRRLRSLTCLKCGATEPECVVGRLTPAPALQCPF